MHPKQWLLALVAVGLVCGCVTPSEVTVVRIVPPQFSIVPAKTVAVVRGAQPREASDGSEESFLDLFIRKLRRVGPYAVLDERTLAALDWDAYLKKTQADVVLRISLGGYCHTSVDLQSMQVTDDGQYEEFDGTCRAAIDIVDRRRGVSLGHLDVVGGGHDENSGVALDDARNDAAQELIDAFMPESQRETIALDGAAPSFADGMQKIKNGDLAGARSLWEATLKTTPDSAPLLYNLGAVSEAMRDAEAAGPYYLKATKLAPNVARYHDALEKLNDRLDDEETAGMTPESLAIDAAAKKVAEERAIADSDAEMLRQTQAQAAKMSEEAVVDRKSGVTWLHIPAGTFAMGCTAGDRDCGGEEEPSHEVTIRRPFDLAFTLTTNDQYQLCVDAGTCRGTADASKKAFPVVGVTWDQAQQFCAWAGGRLPREAEWEWAARGGVDGWQFPWGRTAERSDGNFGKLPGVDYVGFQPEIAWSADAHAARLTPVGQYAKNGYGLDGMAGNVYQWTADWMANYNDSAESDPTGPASGSKRVLRGGAFTNTAGASRVSARIGLDPSTAAGVIGFRCARDVPAK